MADSLTLSMGNGAQISMTAPQGYQFVSNEFIKEYDQFKQQADFSKWWSKEDVLDRYGVSQTWVSHNILNVNKFQQQLDGFVFNFGGQTGYRYEPTAFSNFMRLNFTEIVNEIKKKR